MKIGLVKETKVPVDNRVALDPVQAAALNRLYPKHEIVVQSSDIRAYSDAEYRDKGIRVVEELDDCDVLFGIKEASPASLIPGKKYFFFGHVAKMQAYNRPLLRAMMQKHISFHDYEYLVDDGGKRLCAFGWWAGVVGVYYTLRGYGIKTGMYSLPKPDSAFTLDLLVDSLSCIDKPPVKILVTGKGRVSEGAQWILDKIGASRLDEGDYLCHEKVAVMSYCVASAGQLVKQKDGDEFSSVDFKEHPENFISDFSRWSAATDILVCAHFWDANAPVYLDKEDLRQTRIRMIGDVTCDIEGSVKSTLRASTHDDPYYDYNPFTEKEEPAFSAVPGNITVMAVDTCPNALARDTSSYFGEKLMEYVFTPMLNGENSDVIERSRILNEGELTERFSYLSGFAAGK